MAAEKKFWAKKDELYLNEVSGKEAPIDPFKKDRVIVQKPNVLANKIVDNEVKIKQQTNTKPVS